MPKRRLTRPQYETYKRTHDYADPLEAEAAKIAREQSSRADLTRQAKGELRRLLGDVATDAEAWDELDDLEFQAERELRNARTHKARLKGLREYEKGE